MGRPAGPEFGPRSSFSSVKLTTKLSLLSLVEDRLDQLSADRFGLVFTGGSSENHSTVGDVPGYGVYSECGITIPAYVPIDERQPTMRQNYLAPLKLCKQQMPQMLQFALIPHMFI